MLNIRTCPTCGSKRIRLVCETVTRRWKGRVYQVPEVEFHECPACGEQVMNVAQLVAAGTVENRPLLPSFLYLGTDAEAKAAALDLPWSKHADYAV